MRLRLRRGELKIEIIKGASSLWMFDLGLRQSLLFGINLQTCRKCNLCYWQMLQSGNLPSNKYFLYLEEINQMLLLIFAEQIRAEGVECRSSTGQCDLPEYCDGLQEFCPSNVFKQKGFPCSVGGVSKTDIALCQHRCY